MAGQATAPADVLVIFGITGDLARKMTYPQGSWGPPGADKLLAGHPRWRDPWLYSHAMR